MDDKVQSAKQWLQRYGEAARDSAALDARADNARARAEAARTSHLDGMPHGGGFAGDSLGAALARIDELEREAQEARAHALKLYHEIDAAIKEISGPGWPDLRAVLRVRYTTPEDAARIMLDKQDGAEAARRRMLERQQRHGRSESAAAARERMIRREGRGT